MGLENRTEGNFITILQGKLCKRVEKGSEGAEERVNKLGNTVYERFYDSFKGTLVSIRVQDGSYGKTWNFGLSDNGELYTLQLSYSNSFATQFLKMLPNIDVSKPIRISPSTKMVDGKNQSSLFINQDGKPIKHAYTKDTPNGLPDMKQVLIKGESIWDDSDRLEFLHNMVMTTIVPKLGGTTEVVEATTDVSEEVEDVPF